MFTWVKIKEGGGKKANLTLYLSKQSKRFGIKDKLYTRT